MTVYTGNPFGGFGGFGGGMRNPRMPTPRPRPMNRPPMNQYQMPPMNQMPRRMPGGPSKGGTTSIQAPPSRGGAPWGGYNPNAGFPGGPGKARNRGQSRGGSWFGGGMPGGPGKGRLQDPFRRQTMQPQPFFGNPTSPQPDLTGSGEEWVGNTRPGGGVAVLDFGQGRTQGPMNMPQPPGFNRMPNVPPQPEKMNDYSSYLDFYNNNNFMPVGNNPPQMGEGGDGQGGVSQPAFEIQPGGMGGSSGLIGKLQEPSQNYNSNFSFEQPTRTANQEMMSGEVERLSRENMMAHDQQNENLKQAVQGGFGMPPAQINQLGPTNPNFLGNTNRGGTSWGNQSLIGVNRGSFGQLGPTNPMQLPEQQIPTVSPFWGRSSPGGAVLQSAGLRNMEYGRGFYGGGITDLYPR